MNRGAFYAKYGGMIPAANLPRDPETLQAMLLAALAETAQVTAERDDAVIALEASEAALAIADQHNAALEKLVADYKHALFGAKSEKADPDTFQLVFEDLETSIEIHTAASAAALGHETSTDVTQPKKRKANRGNLPTHLTRREVVIEPETTVCECGCQRHVIGEDVSERLEIIPAQFAVIVTRRPKYACRECEDKVWQAPATASLIPGGMATEATVAHVLVSKYADHLPLYRQAQIYGRQGIDLDRSTLAKWVGRAAHALEPVFDALMANLKTSTKLFMDETTAPVQDPGAGKVKKGYFWALARDDRPWGSDGPTSGPPGVAFTYAPSRSGNVAADILKDFSGILQVDGYAGYNKVLYRRGDDVQLAYCWAHARRKLKEIARADTPTPIAYEGIALVGKLYALEKVISGNSPEERLAQRQKLAAPIIDALKVWLVTSRARVSNKTPIGQALAYIAKYWDGLCLFLEDGRIELDNNTVERTIRPIALNRKNALFAGHEAGAKNWAMIASLIETCKLNGINPHSYLTAALNILVNDQKNADLDALMPWNFTEIPQ